MANELDRHPLFTGMLTFPAGTSYIGFISDGNKWHQIYYGHYDEFPYLHLWKLMEDGKSIMRRGANGLWADIPRHHSFYGPADAYIEKWEIPEPCIDSYYHLRWALMGGDTVEWCDPGGNWVPCPAKADSRFTDPPKRYRVRDAKDKRIADLESKLHDADLYWVSLWSGDWCLGITRAGFISDGPGSIVNAAAIKFDVSLIRGNKCVERIRIETPDRLLRFSGPPEDYMLILDGAVNEVHITQGYLRLDTNRR